MAKILKNRREASAMWPVFLLKAVAFENVFAMHIELLGFVVIESFRISLLCMVVKSRIV